jgi:hypothetical protein
MEKRGVQELQEFRSYRMGRRYLELEREWRYVDGMGFARRAGGGKGNTEDFWVS